MLLSALRYPAKCIASRRPLLCSLPAGTRVITMRLNPDTLTRPMYGISECLPSTVSSLYNKEATKDLPQFGGRDPEIYFKYEAEALMHRSYTIDGSILHSRDLRTSDLELISQMCLKISSQYSQQGAIPGTDAIYHYVQPSYRSLCPYGLLPRHSEHWCLATHCFLEDEQVLCRDVLSWLE